MTLSDVLRALRRRMVLLSVSALVGVAIGVAIAFSGSPTHRATATVLLTEPAVTEPGTAGLDSQQKLTLLTHTYVEVATSKSFVEDAIEGTGLAAGDLSVAAEAVKSTPALELSVSAADGDRAETAVSALVDELQRSPTEVLGPVAEVVDVLVIERTDAERESSNPVFVVVTALVAALVIAGTFALLLETQ